MNDFMKLIYAIFVGVAITIVAAMSITALYPQPSFPEMSSHGGEITDQQIQEEEAMYRQYDADVTSHANETAKITLAAAVSVFVIGYVTTRLKKQRLSSVIVDGMLLGGLFTAIYAASRGQSLYFMQTTPSDRWVPVAAAGSALVMAIIIAQIKFAPAPRPKNTKRKK